MDFYMWKGLLIFFLLAGSLSAQTFTIKGIVNDKEKKEGLARANVLIVRVKDVSKNGALTDNKGKFTIENVQNGKYYLKVSYIGYKDFEDTIFVRNRDLNLGEISLEQTEILKSEVLVEAAMPTGNQNADTMQFNAQAFKVNKDATAEDLIQKMPGVTTDGSTVKAQGEAIKQVLVDGKQFFGEDPSAALKNLPAEVIDKVQIFDKQSDQSAFTGFDDGSSAKTMNIITKSFMRKGEFGNLTAGYGDNGKYSVGGIMNFFQGDRRITLIGLSNNINKANFSPEDILGVIGGGSQNNMRMNIGRTLMGSSQGRSMLGGGGGGPMGDFLVAQQDGISTVHSLGFNYSDDIFSNLNINGSYFFNYTDNTAEKLTDRYYISNSVEPSVNYLQNYLSNSKNINHRANFKIEYNIDSNNRLIFRPRLTAQLNDGVSNSLGWTMQDTNYLNKASNKYNSYLNGLNSSFGITYMHKFNSDGRSASLDLGASKNKSDGDYYLNSLSEYYLQEAILDTILQPTTSEKESSNLNANITLNEPITKNHLLQANYYIGSSASTSEKLTFDDFGNVLYLKDSLSNVYESKAIIHRPGISYRYQSDSLRAFIGLSYEWNEQTQDKTYPKAFNMTKSYQKFLPNAMLQYNISKTKNLRFNYRANSDLPSLDKLQDVLDNSDPTQLSIGNPNLSQSYKHNFALRYSAVDPGSSTTFFAMANANFTNDYIGNSVFTAKRDTVVDNIPMLANSRLTRPVNLDGFLSISSFITYGLPLSFMKTNLNAHTFLNYSKTPGLINGEKNYSDSKSASLGLTFASNISENVDFTITSNTTYYNSKSSLSSASSYEYYSQATRANINLNFWDIFNSQIALSHQYYWKISDEYNPKNVSLNLSISKKFLANNQAELKLSFIDVLNASQSLQRNSNELYWEDVTTNVLKKYVMLSFTYTIRNFGGSKPENILRPPKHDGPGGFGGPPPQGGGFNE